MNLIDIHDLEPIFTLNALRRNAISHEVCFLCAKHIADTSRTVEHTIPKWIQDDCNLGDKVITFRNGTGMLYKHATVPCCAKCNNESLSRLEMYMSRRIRLGKVGVRSITPAAWYLWIGKIRLALAYKDCLIALDRTNPTSPRLAMPEELEDVSAVRHALQFTRFKRDVWLDMDTAPDSTMVFYCQDTPEIDFRWDFYNMLHPMITAIRIGEAGIIVSFHDERFIAEAHAHSLLAYKFIDLHPMQFKEIFARVSWIATHQHSYSAYCTLAGIGSFRVERVPVWKANPGDLFYPLDADAYPAILHQVQGINDTDVPAKHQHSIIHYDNGNDIYQIPWAKVKADSYGKFLAGKGWIDTANLPDAPHFGPSHLQIIRSE